MGLAASTGQLLHVGGLLHADWGRRSACWCAFMFVHMYKDLWVVFLPILADSASFCHFWASSAAVPTPLEAQINMNGLAKNDPIIRGAEPSSPTSDEHKGSKPIILFNACKKEVGCTSLNCCCPLPPFAPSPSPCRPLQSNQPVQPSAMSSPTSSL